MPPYGWPTIPVSAIQAALESGGVEFTNEEQPGVRLNPKG